MRNKIKSQVLRLWNHFRDDSLFRNAVYLMLATGVMAGLGFIFWFINAKLYSAENIGLATTLISVMNLIALLSLIGFDTAFVRFLPTSTNRNEKLNTGLILVSIASVVLSIGFLIGVHLISPKLSFVGDNPIYGFLFIVSCVMNSLNVLTDSVFLAGRKTNYTLIINTIFSVFKIILPFAFVGFGPMGIFVSAALAQTVGVVLSIGVMIWKFDFRPVLSISKSALKIVWRYSTANYVAGIFNLLPPTLLPLLIVNDLSPEAAGYYYIAMMMGNLLYSIPWSITRSLFAEGSHDESSLKVNIPKAIRIISLFLVPAMIFLFVGGNLLLKIFGENYAKGGTDLLHYITISAVAVAINGIFAVYFRIRKSLGIIIISSILSTILIIGLSYLMESQGLTGVGKAWFLGNVGLTILYLLIFLGRRSIISPSKR